MQLIYIKKYNKIKKEANLDLNMKKSMKIQKGIC